jgi:PIN domain nuclease of toxin-antitoxin system
VKLLLDTHLLLWAAAGSRRLSAGARSIINDPANEPLFSAASICEIVIKQALRRRDFLVDARELRRGLIDNGYAELAIGGQHALAVGALPPIHSDPFDRMLIAQAAVEGMTLLTTDEVVARYAGPVRLV